MPSLYREQHMARVEREHFPGAAVAIGLSLLLALMRAVRSARVAVVGDSMRPALHPGDRLLALPVPRTQGRPGALVVTADPRGGRRLVKRVHARCGRWAELRGDNPAASTDSRELGAVALPPLVWRVRWRYAPPTRAGALAQRVPTGGQYS